MDFNPFDNIILNLDLYTMPSKLKATLKALEKILEQPEINKEVRMRSLTFRVPPDPLKYAIVDLECDPPAVFGLIFYDRLYQLFITDYSHVNLLYKLIWEILILLSEYYIFTFSPHEIRFFAKILPFKLSLEKNKSDQIKLLKIINIQTRISEGLVPALYSIGEESVDDPLLRNAKKINYHFEQGHYTMILDHNKSCLLSTQTLVKKRYLKQHLF